MKKFAIRIGVLGVIAVALFVLIRFTQVGNYLNVDEFVKNKQKLLALVEKNYVVSVLIYIFLYIAVVALSIPGATVLSLLGGFLYGPVRAVIYVNIGATVGAFLVFLAARFFLGEMIQTKWGEKLERFNREIESYGKNYLLMMRFIPIFPFFLINLFAGVSTVRATSFLWTTSLGIIPGSIVYTYTGFAVSCVGLAEGIPLQIYIAFVLLALISLFPVIFKKLRLRQRAQF